MAIQLIKSAPTPTLPRREGKQTAFTLAEVLITLGIIGVVAALTLPTLISNYQKKVTIERLKQFSSMIQQANAQRKADEITNNVETLEIKDLEPKNPDDILRYFDIYFKPYLKLNDTVKTQKGILAYLANGSAMYMQKERDCGNGCTYIIFCPQAKYCEQLDESKSTAEAMVDGKHSHTFWHNTGTPDIQYKTLGYDRDGIISRTKISKTYCTTLIYYDGWEISDDNPCWQ